MLVDGWYYTGDFGNIDEDGHLIVMDRMDDLQPIAGNKRFSPQYAETRLRFSSYIKNALVVGQADRDYAVALINVDYDNVGHWAESNRIVYTTFLDLSQKEGIIGPPDGSRPREVLRRPDWLDRDLSLEAVEED